MNFAPVTTRPVTLVANTQWVYAPDAGDDAGKIFFEWTDGVELYSVQLGQYIPPPNIEQVLFDEFTEAGPGLVLLDAHTPAPVNTLALNWAGAGGSFTVPFIDSAVGRVLGVAGLTSARGALVDADAPTSLVNVQLDLFLKSSINYDGSNGFPGFVLNVAGILLGYSTRRYQVLVAGIHQLEIMAGTGPLNGVFVGGQPDKLVSTVPFNFVAEGVLVGDWAAGGGLGGDGLEQITGISTTTNPNDTLEFAEGTVQPWSDGNAVSITRVGAMQSALMIVQEVGQSAVAVIPLTVGEVVDKTLTLKVRMNGDNLEADLWDGLTQIGTTALVGTAPNPLWTGSGGTNPTDGGALPRGGLAALDNDAGLQGVWIDNFSWEVEQ